MFPCLIKDFAKVHQRQAVELEGLDGAAARLSQANNDGEIFIPGEMVTPALPARMVNRDDRSANRIRSMRVIIFMIVAALTGQRQILRLACSTLAFRKDVLDRKLLKRKLCLPEAVLAAATSPLGYEPS